MRLLLSLLLLVSQLQAADPARLTITARDGQGRPVARLWLYTAADVEPPFRVDDHDLRTDSQGRIVLDGLPAGPHYVSLSGQPYHEWQAREVLLHPGDNALDAVLWPQDEATPGAILDILVIGRDSRPAPRTEVEVDVRCAGLPPAPDQLRLGGLGMFMQTERDGRHEVLQRGVLTTDSEGRLRFQAPPGPLNVCVTARRETGTGHDIWAPAGRVTSLRAYLAEAEPNTRPAQPSRPVPAPRLARVVDAAGRPLGGLPLALRAFDDMNDAEAERYSFTMDPAQRPTRVAPPIVTDAEGGFAIPVQAQRWAARVKAAGWCSSEVETVGAGAEPVVFRLTQRSRVARGQVVDAAGQRVPGAVAWAVPIGQMDPDGPPRVATLDRSVPWPGGIQGLLPGGQFALPCEADGRFTLDQLDDAVYRFLASAPGWGLPTVITRRPGEEPGEPLTLRLTRLASLTGRAHRPDGTAWPGAPITLVGDDGEVTELSADAGGRWRWADLAPGRRTLRAYLPGCQELRAAVDLVGGQDAEWTLRPGWGQTLRGTVLWADGRPAARVRLTCPMPHSLPRVAWTDEAGDFRLTGLRDGDRRIDITTARGAEPVIYLKAPQPGPLTLRLARAARLAGRVVDTTGQPVPGARCELDREGEEAERSTTSDGQGRFAFEGLLPGQWSLHVRTNSAYSADTSLRLAGGEARRDISVRLRPYHREPTRPAGTVVGRVIGTDGQPVAGATVEYEGTRLVQEKAITDADGRYRLTSAGGRRISLRVRSEGCRADDLLVTVRPGGEVTAPECRLCQRPVSGRLTQLPPGLRPEDCTVELGIAALDAQGRLLPEGEACVLPMSPAGDVPPQVPVPALCELGWLAFPTARTVRAGYPWVMPCGEEAVHARADGTFTIALEPGRQRLVVRVATPRGRAAARLTLADQEVDIPAAGPVALEVPLALGRGVLHGFVAMGHRDEAVYGIETVVAYRGESLTPVAVALTQPDGAWRMTGLPAGDYRLAVPGSWLGSVFVRATLGDGQTLEVAQPAPGTHTLRGRVGGKLPAKLVVTARSDAALRSTDVDRDGRFAFEGLPAGSYQLTLWSGEVRRVLRLPEPHAVPGPEVRLDW